MELSGGIFLAQGAWNETEAQIKLDGAVDRVLKVHQRQAEFYIALKVPEHLAPGEYPLEGTFYYRACDNKICTLPKVLPFRLQVRVVPKR